MRTDNMIEMKKTSDKQKSHQISNHDGMSNISKSRCKGKCSEFKAIRPENGSWYASGNSRCNVCDIFVTPEGVRNGLFCSCCNIRVRTRPRASGGKERYFEQVKKLEKSQDNQNTINENNSLETNSTQKSKDDENWWLEESTKKRLAEESNETKKSTPIYDEIDESVKTYYELKEFLESKIKPQANYQYVMLKELLEYGELHKGEIAESLAYFNNKDTTDLETVKKYLKVPVYDVLLKHELVTSEGYYCGLPYYTLNVKLADFQRIELIDYFIEAIATFNKEHNIPENEFPNANNMDNIEWSDANIESSSKVEKIKNFVKNIRTVETTSKIVKECPKCHETKIEGFTGIEFDNEIEKYFGFRQSNPNNPQSRKPQSYCRKCRNGKKELDSIEENKISENIEKKSTIEEKNDKTVTESEKFLEFEPQENGLAIKHYELKNIDIIQKDQDITNDELVAKFGVGNMGGIRHSKKNNVLILCSTFSNQYDDDVDEDAHLIKFTGEGQSGDQTLSKGNHKIANSENIPMLFFKEKHQEQGVRKRGPLDNIYSFVGKVRYVKHYWKEEQDVNGNKRQVLKFVLEIQS